MYKVDETQSMQQQILIKGATIFEINEKTKRHGDVNRIQKVGDEYTVVFDDGDKMNYPLLFPHLVRAMEMVKNKPDKINIVELGKGMGDLVGCIETDQHGKCSFVRF